MSKLYLFNYNNYFNRIFKREEDIASYGTPIYSLSNTNFNYNDGVTTEHVINYDGQDGDYVIIADDNTNIVSRWFVIENTRTRGNQHKLGLRRDLIADCYTALLNSPMIIDRGKVNKDNPLIFNSEGFSFNQIKKEEILLKDNLGYPWIIMYMAKNASAEEISLPSQTYTPDITLNTSIENSIYAAGTKYTRANATTYSIIYYDDGARATNVVYRVKFDERVAYWKAEGWYLKVDMYLENCDANYFIQKVGGQLVDNYQNFDDLLNIYLNKPLISEENLKLIKKASDEHLIIKDTNNKYYRVQVVVNDSGEEGDIEENTALFNDINNTVLAGPFTVLRNAGPNTYKFGTNYEEVITILTDVTAQYGNVITLDPSSKFETLDSECNIIAIPYADALVHNSYYLDPSDTPIYTDLSISKESQMNIAQQFAQKYTKNVVYDMQLLPYCPVQSFIEGNWLDASGYTGDTRSYTKWNLGNGYMGIVFHLTTKQLTFDINQRLSIPTVTGDVDLDTKISSECDLIRLCSPNYNGIFEFSVAKNNGVDSFNVDVTLKPYNPYIHINPNFKNIYGSDFNDARGLICGGDFSLPITGNQFEEYELQNKNYQIAFNRQIEHMDFMHGQERIQSAFGLGVGTVQGAVSGATAGGLAGGGPYGAIAGAVIGGTTSLIGGMLDWSMMASRQQEDRSFAIDNFNYQLGNIKALPYSLNKVNPFTVNNKIFPFIEIYSCTDEEKSILINKIEYTSMNINSIGIISEYILGEKCFVSGVLIRNEELEMPTHELNELAEELKKGVYF